MQGCLAGLECDYTLYHSTFFRCGIKSVEKNNHLTNATLLCCSGDNPNVSCFDLTNSVVTLCVFPTSFINPQLANYHVLALARCMRKTMWKSINVVRDPFSFLKQFR